MRLVSNNDRILTGIEFYRMCSNRLLNRSGNHCSRWSLDPPDKQQQIIVSPKQLLKGLWDNGKVPGTDEIPAELLKAGLAPVPGHISNLIESSLVSNSVPQEFKNAKIETLGKN